jgi:hypothetical protein
MGLRKTKTNKFPQRRRLFRIGEKPEFLYIFIFILKGYP